MSGKVVQFRSQRFAPNARAPHSARPISGECYLVAGQDGGWVVVDMSASGDSAGLHGWYANRAKALVEGRKVAASLGRRFLDNEGDAA